MIWQRFSSWPFADKRKLQSPLQFSAALRGPSWTKGSCSRRCSSPRPSVSSVDKCVAVAVLRGPSWPFVDKRKLQSPLQFSAALRVLRGQMCCRCSSSRPSVSSVDKCVAVAVLRGPSWPFVALRGQKEVAVAVAVLRGPPSPPWTNVLPLQFSAALRVLRGQMCCRCSSSRPSVSSVDKCVAVAVLRGPSWPFVVLRGKRFPPLALRGQTKLCPCISQFRQTSASPGNPAGTRHFTIPSPLPPTPYPLPFLPLRLVCDPASP